MAAASRTFACTQCGACCNRAPEVELGEAAGLTDVFAFQLLFRLYSLPRRDPAPWVNESKALLDRFAAHSFEAKARIEGKTQPRSFYLTISALALDPLRQPCPALIAGQCGIYERRPLSCRSVPLHYSRPSCLAEADLAAFLAQPSHACRSDAEAPVLIAWGEIVDPDIGAARDNARDQAGKDKAWKMAILFAMQTGDPRFPSLDQIQAAASSGAVAVPMTAAWRLAAEQGLLDSSTLPVIAKAQHGVLDRMQTDKGMTLAAAQEIAELRASLG